MREREGSRACLRPLIRVLSRPVDSTSRLACVVLFDIDGTLLTGPAVGQSAGVSAMAKCAHELTGHVDVHLKVEFAGRTDRQIARDILVATGVDEPSRDVIDAFVACYVRNLHAGIRARPYVALGGVREAVQLLHARGATVGLGTGNVRAGAETKLKSAGLGDLFDFELGGYGDDANTRAEVLRIGAERCDPSKSLPVIVVGDTPHDVRAALEIGALCLAVSTGMYKGHTLVQAGAHRLLDRLDASLADELLDMLSAPCLP